MEQKSPFSLLMEAAERKNEERRRKKRALWAMSTEIAAENLKAVMPSDEA